jgi:hypothetical protein
MLPVDGDNRAEFDSPANSGWDSLACAGTEPWWCTLPKRGTERSPTFRRLLQRSYEATCMS